MTLTYLLDTNVLSEPLKPRPDAGLVRRLRRHEGRIATASVVWHELRFGLERLPPSRRREAIERYLLDVVRPNVPILDYTPEAADWHAAARARLEARGKPTGFADGQIAAIAVTNALRLVTRNTADFAPFDGLRTERW